MVYLEQLREDPDLVRTLRIRGRNTAENYTWPSVIRQILRMLQFVATTKGFRVPTAAQRPKSRLTLRRRNGGALGTKESCRTYIEFMRISSRR